MTSDSTCDLTESAERNRLLLSSMAEGLAFHEIILDDNGKPCDYRFLDVNLAFEDMTGLRGEDIVGRTLREVMPGLEPFWIERYAAVAMTGASARFDEYARSLDRYYEVVAYSPRRGQFATLISDITDRRRREQHAETGREVLRVLNEQGDLRSSIERILGVLGSRTGFDAVGIRLRDGDDFPYFAQAGFPEDLLERENSLADHDAGGAVCRDDDGSVRLEGICGLVISGKAGSNGPSFTAGGSFWTNDASELPHLPPAENSGHRFRHRCVHRGYSSMAVVPIRSTDGIVGLIHLLDRRKGLLTSDQVGLLEGIAAHIGTAITRKLANEGLLRNRARLRQLAAELAVSREDEQRRFGVSLDEGVVQLLVAAKMAAQGVAADTEGSPANEQARKLVELIGESISAVRSLTSELTPAVLFELGLRAALLGLVDRKARVNGLRCTVRTDMATEYLRGETATFVFRIVREALDNVVEHAHVLHASVTVEKVGGWIVVGVDDLGVGFDPALIDSQDDVRGFGLFGIREECLDRGGTMEVSGGPGQGTRIEVRVPDEAETDHESG